MLIFQNNTMEGMCSHAQTDYPKECCGILLGKRLDGKRYVHKVIRTSNIVDESEKATHFSMNPLEIIEVEMLAEKEKIEIIGFYHSHPDYEAVASREDMLYMMEGYSYPILSVRNGICVKVSSFEKRKQTDTDVKEEIVKEK